jgi:hypothetical protein
MGKSAIIPHPLSKAASYDADPYTWALEQAAKLRSGSLADIDVEHIAEELEALGGSQRAELENRYKLILQHLLKYRYQPSHRTPSWRETILNNRDAIQILTKHYPGLKKDRDRLFEDAWERARHTAAEETGLPITRFPERCPWSRSEVETFQFPSDDLE